VAKRVITFGEVLMRNAAPRHERFTQARQWELIYGGTESNVAVALAHFGVDAAFVTAFPPNELGQAAANYVRQYGVDTSEIIWRGDRLGLYFLETGASVRPSKVVYDRKGSAFSELRPGDIDWQTVFDGADWFHFTGISAAVSESAAAVCGEATAAAQAAGLTVSCDLNYRSALWSPDEARKVMRPLMANVDVLLGGREDADLCLDVKTPNTPGAGGLDHEACEETIAALINEFGFSKVGLTLRQGEFADFNDVSACYWDGSKSRRGRTVELRGMVDRVGGGDAFSAGIIYANLEGWDGQRAVDFAVAANAIAHTFHGDFNLATVEEVEHIALGGGRMQR
jgi:2-dehydro-3-deoxygluconokinase